CTCPSTRTAWRRVCRRWACAAGRVSVIQCFEEFMRVHPLYVSSSQNIDAEEGESLVGAVDAGDLKQLKALLQLPHMKDIAQTETGLAAFMRAACLNRVEMMDLIFPEIELRINERNKEGETAAMQAAINNSHEALAWLMEQGADVNIMDDSGSTPFMEYVKSLGCWEEPSEKMLKLFLDAHIDLVAADADGRTPLMLLAQKPGPAKYLLLERTLAMMKVTPRNSSDSDGAVEAKNSLNAVDKNGCTALHLATKCRDYDFGSKLVRAGVLISTVANDGRSALDAAKDAASNEDDRAFVSYLKKAEVLQKNQAMIHAAEQRKKVLEQQRFAEMTDESSADRDDDSWGRMKLNPLVVQQLFWPERFETDLTEVGDARTPLLGAVFARDRERISYILKNEVSNIDVRGPNGWTPLMQAAAGEADFFRFFLDELDGYNVKFDLNLVNNINQTALVVAANHGRAENMKILLQRNSGVGPDVNIVDNDAGNALMYYFLYCREELDVDLVALFLDKGLNVAWRTNAQQTATMMLSAAKGNAAKELFLKAPGVKETIDFLDVNNASALMHAAARRDYDYFKMLVDAGADVNLESKGNSARSFAKKTGDARFLELIDSVAGRDAGETQAGQPVARRTDSD
ncbi:MAG: ankyrin repeat domain-containing protein, partial [Janthinobacterium sp.]